MFHFKLPNKQTHTEALRHNNQILVPVMQLQHHCCAHCTLHCLICIQQNLQSVYGSFMRKESSSSVAVRLAGRRVIRLICVCVYVCTYVGVCVCS